MISIKSPEEIEILKEGGKRHAYILSEVEKKINPGVNTLELEELARKLIEEGGDSSAFLNYRPVGARRKYPAALCVSINDEIVHGIPNENPKVLSLGDIVTIDLGLVHKGLITDSAITVGVGSVDKKSEALIRATEKSLYDGISEALAGNRVGDISFAIHSSAKDSGFAVAEGLAGHGVGYKVHEDPFVPNIGPKNEGPILRPGMVLALEPMLVFGRGEIVLDGDGYTYKTKDGGRSAHFEHTIAITEGEPLIITENL